ncbi:MAG: hypothetical protein J1F32_05850 [Erysipelotrichales bacterium]|nr:hypothetical protein [Erysipelotrichales bacterium]
MLNKKRNLFFILISMLLVSCKTDVDKSSIFVKNEKDNKYVTIQYLQDNKIQIDYDYDNYEKLAPGYFDYFSISLNLEEQQEYHVKTTVLNFSSPKLFYEGEEIYSPLNWTVNEESVDEKTLFENIESWPGDIDSQTNIVEIMIRWEWPFDNLELSDYDYYDSIMGYIFNVDDQKYPGYTIEMDTRISFVLEIESDNKSL